MTFAGVFVFTWNDERLTWNTSISPLSYTVMVKVWKPVFRIVNNLAGDRWIWHEFNMLPEVFSSGHIQLQVPVNSECECKVDAVLFPFDEQFCGIEIIGWPVSIIGPYFSDNQQSNYLKMTYTGNEEWEFVNYENRNTSIDAFVYKTRYSTLTFAFKFKRRSAFYMVNFIMPSVAMSVMAVWTFILPVESGERASYSLTIMLAFTVLLTLFSSLLPSASVTIPYIAIYLLGIMLICALGTSLTALSVHLYHRREPVPAWIKRLCCRSGSSNIVSKRPRKELTDSMADDDYEIPQSHAAIYWREASEKLDFVCFWFFLILVICLNISLLVLLTLRKG